MDSVDLVLLISANNEGGHLRGRTALQKLAYFITEREKLSLEFTAHYYGPYSSDISNAVDSLVATGLLQEFQVVSGIPIGATFEHERCDYLLTDAGKSCVALIADRQPEQTKRIREILQRIREVIGSDYQTLSVGAKAHHILKREKRPLHATEIAKVAESIGWRLNPDRINQVCDFLRKLGFMPQAVAV